MNENFLQDFTLSYSHVLPSTGSDHCPLIFFSNHLVTVYQKSFKFEQKWLLEDDYFSTIEGNWMAHVLGLMHGFLLKFWKTIDDLFGF